jgi:hypothetical protein
VGSIPDGVTENFRSHKSFLSHCGPGVDSASNRNEYQEYFLGVKAAGAGPSDLAVCSRSPAEIVGFNPTGGMYVCLLCVLCVVR